MRPDKNHIYKMQLLMTAADRYFYFLVEFEIDFL